MSPADDDTGRRPADAGGGRVTTDARVGTSLAGYTILALLGRASTSVVYRAEQARRAAAWR